MKVLQLLGLSFVFWANLETGTAADSQTIDIENYDSPASADSAENAVPGQQSSIGNGGVNGNGSVEVPVTNGTEHSETNSSIFAGRDPEEQAQLERSLSHTDPVYLSEGLSQLRAKCQRDAEAVARNTANSYPQNDPSSNANAEKLRIYQSTPMQPTNDSNSIPETSILNINQQQNLSEIMYQGDMILTTGQLDSVLEAAGLKESAQTPVKRRKRQAAIPPNYRTWDNNQIFYYFDTTASAAAINSFQAAVQFWQAYTCVDFFQSTTAPNRIRVFKGSGCYSYIGQIGGEQDLSLGEGCEYFGTASHEIGHAMGFFHEQSREDRDDYIVVHIENLEPDFVDQYNKETTATNNNFGLKYDYGSVMQYSMFDASSNNLPTMLALDADYSPTLGSHYVAFRDVLMMNVLYNCMSKCDNATSAKCENGGYPNPNNCKICNCPGLYGGDLCNERPNDGGSYLTANPDWQWINVTIGDGSYNVKLNQTELTYWISSEEGTQIEFKIDYITAYQIAGCKFGGAEFKVQEDQLATGYRACLDPYYKNLTLVSTKNFVPVRVFNSLKYTITNIRYRQIGTPITTTTETTTPQITTTVNTTGLVDSQPYCPDVVPYGHCRVRYIRKKCQLGCATYSA